MFILERCRVKEVRDVCEAAILVANRELKIKDKVEVYVVITDDEACKLVGKQNILENVSSIGLCAKGDNIRIVIMLHRIVKLGSMTGAILKHAILHEARHAYQYSKLPYVMMDRYCDYSMEEDANSFAIHTISRYKLESEEKINKLADIFEYNKHYRKIYILYKVLNFMFKCRLIERDSCNV